jgi:hypothetical protein
VAAGRTLRRQSGRTQIAPICSVVGYEKFFPVVAYNDADIARGASAELSQSAAKHQDPHQAVEMTGAVLGYAL